MCPYICLNHLPLANSPPASPRAAWLIHGAQSMQCRYSGVAALQHLQPRPPQCPRHAHHTGTASPGSPLPQPPSCMEPVKLKRAMGLPWAPCPVLGRLFVHVELCCRGQLPASAAEPTFRCPPPTPLHSTHPPALLVMSPTHPPTLVTQSAASRPPPAPATSRCATSCTA